MVILVAGATGFIGAALARSLAGRGHRIVGTTRDVASSRPGAAVSHWLREYSAKRPLPIA